MRFSGSLPFLLDSWGLYWDCFSKNVSLYSMTLEMTFRGPRCWPSTSGSFRCLKNSKNSLVVISNPVKNETVHFEILRKLLTHSRIPTDTNVLVFIFLLAERVPDQFIAQRGAGSGANAVRFPQRHRLSSHVRIVPDPETIRSIYETLVHQ